MFRMVVWLGLLRAPAQAAGRKFHSSPHAPFFLTNDDMLCGPTYAILCRPSGPRTGLGPQPLHGDPT